MRYNRDEETIVFYDEYSSVNFSLLLSFSLSLSLVHLASESINLSDSNVGNKREEKRNSERN